MLEDRFGKLPKQVNFLFEALRLRWLCKKLGFERLILKGGKLRCYFLQRPTVVILRNRAVPKVHGSLSAKKAASWAFAETDQQGTHLRTGRDPEFETGEGYAGGLGGGGFSLIAGR
jgi:transcription-repair coupling factor (superfamily II helicase)